MHTDANRALMIGRLQRSLTELERVAAQNPRRDVLVLSDHAETLNACIDAMWEELGGDEHAGRYRYPRGQYLKFTSPGGTEPQRVVWCSTVLRKTRAVLAALHTRADPVDTVSGQA